MIPTIQELKTAMPGQPECFYTNTLNQIKCSNLMMQECRRAGFSNELITMALFTGVGAVLTQMAKDADPQTAQTVFSVVNFLSKLVEAEMMGGVL